MWPAAKLRVTPTVPLRLIAGFGTLIEESERGWLNTGGASAMLMQRTQARGKKGETIRVDIGEEIVEE